jgi:CubicO group peptidase (beta-lactamase class C family)
MGRACWAAVALALASTACTPVAPVATVAPSFDDRAFSDALDKQLSALEAEGFGGAVVIEQGQRVVFSRGYGYANREAGVRFTPDTVAQVASITKSQTAAAIAMLIGDGRVALTDPLGKFVPEAPEPGRSRTIAQLLAHSSGLADTCTDDFVRQSERMLVDKCLALPLAYPVGSDNYSNMGYSALALVVQRVTGMNWEAALKARVWQPLGLTGIATQFPRVPPAQLARGYDKGVASPELSHRIEALKGDDWALRGNGALSASARSMVRYVDRVVDGTKGLPPSVRTMLLAPVPGQEGKVREGFGMVFRYNDAGQMIRMGHSGSDGVFLSYLGWLPRNDVRFYFVGNNGEDEAQKALTAVLVAMSRIPPRSHHT